MWLMFLGVVLIFVGGGLTVFATSRLLREWAIRRNDDR